MSFALYFEIRRSITTMTAHQITGTSLVAVAAGAVLATANYQVFYLSNISMLNVEVWLSDIVDVIVDMMRILAVCGCHASSHCTEHGTVQYESVHFGCSYQCASIRTMVIDYHRNLFIVLYTRNFKKGLYFKWAFWIRIEPLYDVSFYAIHCMICIKLWFSRIRCDSLWLQSVWSLNPAPGTWCQPRGYEYDYSATYCGGEILSRTSVWWFTFIFLWLIAMCCILSYNV